MYRLIGSFGLSWKIRYRWDTGNTMPIAPSGGGNGKLWLALLLRLSRSRYDARRGNLPYLPESLS